MNTHATRIIVLELDSIKVGEIYVHSGSIAENHEVVQISFGVKSGLESRKLNKCLPYLDFLKYKDLGKQG